MHFEQHITINVMKILISNHITYAPTWTIARRSEFNMLDYTSHMCWLIALVGICIFVASFVSLQILMFQNSHFKLKAFLWGCDYFTSLSWLISINKILLRINILNILNFVQFMTEKIVTWKWSLRVWILENMLKPCAQHTNQIAIAAVTNKRLKKGETLGATGQRLLADRTMCCWSDECFAAVGKEFKI